MDNGAMMLWGWRGTIVSLSRLARMAQDPSVVSTPASPYLLLGLALPYDLLRPARCTCRSRSSLSLE
jgi:hypothetical protein